MAESTITLPGKQPVAAGSLLHRPVTDWRDGGGHNPKWNSAKRKFGGGGNRKNVRATGREMREQQKASSVLDIAAVIRNSLRL